ncbi:MAG: potassium/proton antiporter [Ignavibacterium sp.]|jgi:cell volume regulation protein A
MIGIEYILLAGSVLILISTAIGKLSDNLGVPTLVLFLVVGMLAGSEGPGGIQFDDPGLASSIGIVALVFILFGGGLDTKWHDVRRVLVPAVGLSTFGVLVTALTVGGFTYYFLDVPIEYGFLLGSIISSTDAAAVFSVLRSKNVSLKGRLRPLLELESGSNDPTAVFLTAGFLSIIRTPETTFVNLLGLFVVQMGLGGVLGYFMGRAMVVLLNRLRFSYDGIYPVFALAFACLIYASTAVLGGSGFLAVYIAGIVLGNSEFVQKKSLFRFFDGLAWLSQIGMFLALGLQVFPSRLVPVITIGLLVSGFLMFVARPLSVFVMLAPTQFDWREKLFISWVGLRGSVPIILATFPLLAGIPRADLLFNLVFFIVLTSALLQGWSIPLAARLLGLATPLERKKSHPLEFEPMAGSDTELVDLTVPYHSDVVGKSIVELGLPPNSLIVLIGRGDQYLVPSGGSVFEPGDTILILVNKADLPVVREILSRRKLPDD